MFVFQPGGLGDVILSAQLVAGLKHAYQDQRIVLGVDASFAGLADQFPVPPDDVFPLNLQPYASLIPENDLVPSLRAVQARLRPFGASIFVGAAFRPRWFSYFVAAALGAERTVFAQPAGVWAADASLDRMLKALVLDPPKVVGPIISDTAPELERYARLARFITGSDRPYAAWSVSPATHAEAGQWLASAGVRSGHYIVCAPFVSSQTPIKAWALESFVHVLNEVAVAQDLAVVLVGTRSESQALRAAAEQLRVPAHVCGGADFRLLSGIFGQATAYLGNDTGPAHLAQALAVPGVAIFGGGHWPAYAPWAPGMTGVVHSLPCFGCDWDCLFEHAFCVHRIPQSVVADELRARVQGDRDGPRVIETSSAEEASSDIIRRADRRYRTLSRDYARMGGELKQVGSEAERRQQALGAQSRELLSISGEAERRAQALEAMQRELSSVSTEAERRAQALETMQRELLSISGEAERRAQALELMQRELLSISGEAERRARALEDTSAALAQLTSAARPLGEVNEE